MIELIKAYTEKHQHPMLCAHRGGKQTTPENTMAAFENALRLKTPAIELDIHLSLDEELVVFHDHTLERTTNLNGSIHQRTYQDLKQADAGSWYHPSFKNERVPLLSDVLDLVKNSSLLFIEIKDYEHPTKNLEKKLVHLLEKHDLTYDCVLHSFDEKILLNLFNINPKLNIGQLYENNDPEILPFVKGLHTSKKLLTNVTTEQIEKYWIASWTFKKIADYDSIPNEKLPHVLIADNIEDFSEKFKET